MKRLAAAAGLAALLVASPVTGAVDPSTKAAQDHILLYGGSYLDGHVTADDQFVRHIQNRALAILGGDTRIFDRATSEAGTTIFVGAGAHRGNGHYAELLVVLTRLGRDEWAVSPLFLDRVR